MNNLYPMKYIHHKFWEQFFSNKVELKLKSLPPVTLTFLTIFLNTKLVDGLAQVKGFLSDKTVFLCSYPGF